jgi:ribosomal protein L11 methyltransferase
VEKERRLGPSFICNWQEGDTAFLFFSRPAEQEVEALVEETSGLFLADRFEMSYSEWHGGPVMPFRAGRFLIVPPWQPCVDVRECLLILLDPGVVFGAGNHPTTRDCLDALQWLMARQRVETVTDLGAGTGLLGLAAARLGAGRVLSVDSNFLAAATTYANIRHNRLQGRCFSICSLAEDWVEHPADLLVANIHYDVMKHLIAKPGFQKKRWFILSGLMRSQADRVKAALLAGCSVVYDEWVRDGAWHTICGANL